MPLRVRRCFFSDTSSTSMNITRPQATPQGPSPTELDPAVSARQRREQTCTHRVAQWLWSALGYGPGTPSQTTSGQLARAVKDSLPEGATDMAEASLVVKSVKRDTSIAPQVRSSSASGAWSKRGLLLAVYLVPAVGADRFAGGDGKAIQGQLGWGPAQVEPMWPMPDDDGQPLRSLVGPPSLPWSLEHSQQTQAEDETYSFSVDVFPLKLDVF